MVKRGKFHVGEDGAVRQLSTDAESPKPESTAAQLIAAAGRPAPDVRIEDVIGYVKIEADELDDLLAKHGEKLTEAARETIQARIDGWYEAIASMRKHAEL